MSVSVLDQRVALERSRLLEELVARMLLDGDAPVATISAALPMDSSDDEWHRRRDASMSSAILHVAGAGACVLAASAAIAAWGAQVHWSTILALVLAAASLIFYFGYVGWSSIRHARAIDDIVASSDFVRLVGTVHGIGSKGLHSVRLHNGGFAHDSIGLDRISSLGVVEIGRRYQLQVKTAQGDKEILVMRVENVPFEPAIAFSNVFNGREKSDAHP